MEASWQATTSSLLPERPVTGASCVALQCVGISNSPIVSSISPATQLPVDLRALEGPWIRDGNAQVRSILASRSTVKPVERFLQSVPERLRSCGRKQL